LFTERAGILANTIEKTNEAGQQPDMPSHERVEVIPVGLKRERWFKMIMYGIRCERPLSGVTVVV